MLFDLDDTLLDYSSAVEHCWSAACRTVGEPAGIALDALVAAIETKRRWFWSDPDRHRRERVRMLDAWTKIAAAALESIGRPSAVLARAIAADFAERRHAAMALYPDALPCLMSLRASGMRLALVTNGDTGMQHHKIARFALAGLFDAILIEGEFGKGKPDPAVYHHVLGALDVAASEATMVGDNLEWDVAGAQRVGMRGVWIDRTARGLADGHPIKPDRVIASLAELCAT
jgi:putative hydrolase of the HAD superfamily